MITIGYSTRSHNPVFIEYLKKSCGINNVTVIEKINNGEKSLSKVYNEILDESPNDIVVLCHDDIYFDSGRWGKKIIKHFETSDFGILGVAGTTQLPASGMWWEDTSKMIGIVNHEHNGKKWESKYSESFDSEIRKSVLVDGLFISMKKSKIKHKFDEEVSGFHFYDVNYCFRNFIDNVKIGVITNIRITHKSIGQTNEQWEINRRIFSEKYKTSLPVKVKISEDDNLSILFGLDNPSEHIEKMTYFLGLGYKVTFICDNLDKKEIKRLVNLGVKIFDSKNIPGYRLGDGKSVVKTAGGNQISKKGYYYKINNSHFDFVFFDSVRLFHILKVTFSSVPKFMLNNLTGLSHDSLVNFDSKVNSNEELLKLVFDSINQLSISTPKVKIVSGYSGKGGSTTAFINLTNFMNENGIDCTFYGPDIWHLDKCKSDVTSNLKFQPTDKIISHFIRLQERPNVDKIVLSSHEKWWFQVGNLPRFFDEVIFLHEDHKNYHSEYDGKFSIIPNLKENLMSGNKEHDVEFIAGVIGSIEARKQTHISIQRALDDGCEKVLIFGEIMDQKYYKNFMEELLKNPKVELVGYSTDKQSMYDRIGRVYHSSVGEVACLVKDECYLTNTKFFGNEETENIVSELSNIDIINLWKKVLTI
jgi:hypothetical protein